MNKDTTNYITAHSVFVFFQNTNELGFVSIAIPLLVMDRTTAHTAANATVSVVVDYLKKARTFISLYVIHIRIY